MCIKKFLFFFHLLLAPIIINAQFTVTQQSGTCCTFEFELNSPNSYFSPSVDPNGGIAYFWYFGDGTWSTQESPTHTFNSTIYDEIYVEITPVKLLLGHVYDDDDDVVQRRTYTGTNPTFSVTQVTPGPHGNMLNLDYNRSLVAGDSVTFILTYSAECNQLPTGKIYFEYDADHFFTPAELPTELPLPSAESFTSNLDYLLSGTIHRKEFSIFNTDGNLKHILVRMRVRPGLPLETEINVSAEFFMGLPENKQCTIAVSESILTLKSHDPNTIETDASFLCESPPVDSLMTYKIRFQNDGIGSAKLVVIRHYIPEYFKFKSIKSHVINGIDYNNVMTLNHADREVIWELKECYLKGCDVDNDNLMGTNQEGIGSTFLIEDTFDTIKYDIRLERELKPCEAIVTQAEIYFDDNPPVWTAPFVTSIGCIDSVPVVGPGIPEPSDTLVIDTSIEKSDVIDAEKLIREEITISNIIICDSCDYDTIIEHINPPTPYIHSSGSPVTFNVPNNLLPNPSSPNDHIFQWYPTYRLDNTRIKNATAKPCRNTHYYLTVTDTANCKRTIIHFPVKVEGYPCFNISVPICLLSLIGFLLIIYLVYKFALKKQ